MTAAPRPQPGPRRDGGRRPGAEVSDAWAEWRHGVDLDEYASRWSRLEAAGGAAHGEVDLVESLLRELPPSAAAAGVLDAGCGTGRVAVELDRRGFPVVGVDLDDDLLAYARRDAPGIPWVHADLATLDLRDDAGHRRRFGLVALPGNVMVFCRPQDRCRIVAALADHLVAGGLVVAGFTVAADTGTTGPVVTNTLTRDTYDECCAHAGLTLVARWSTWDRSPDDGGPYAVSVHVAPSTARRGA